MHQISKQIELTWSVGMKASMCWQGILILGWLSYAIHSHFVAEERYSENIRKGGRRRKDSLDSHLFSGLLLNQIFAQKYRSTQFQPDVNILQSAERLDVTIPETISGNAAMQSVFWKRISAHPSQVEIISDKTYQHMDKRSGFSLWKRVSLTFYISYTLKIFR